MVLDMISPCRIFIAIVLIAFTFYAIPVLFYIEEKIYGAGSFVFFVFYYPFILWMTLLILKAIKRNKPKSVREITVDRCGIHYEKSDGGTQSLLYTQLEKTQPPIVSDVFTTTIGRYGPTVCIPPTNPILR